jgi:DNA-binding CsgD family transcriptional regulator
VSGNSVVAGHIDLVGRERELHRLVSGIAANDRAAYVVAGTAGVGKTRLVAEVAQAASAQGRASLHVVATKATRSIPFGAFAPLLTYAESSPTSFVRRLHQAVDAIVARLDDGAGLLVIDDSHHLDNCSSALVHHLVRDETCGVLASLRTPGPAPDSVTALWKDGLAIRVDLEPLTEPEVGELAARALGAPLTGPGVRWLWEATNGNPLHVRELILAAADSGTLIQDSGVWVLKSPVPATQRLSDLVADRLGVLAAGTKKVVEVLAVGEPLGFSLVESICTPDGIEEAEQQGLVVVQDKKGRAEASLGHPLYGEVLRQRMPRSRRRRLSAQLAEALRATGLRRRDDILRLATWELESGTAGDTVILERAAEMARHSFDLPLAARLARAALASGAGWTATLALAETEMLSGHHVEAKALFADLATRGTTDAERVLVAQNRVYLLGELMGDRPAAIAAVDEALAIVSDPISRARLSFLQIQFSLLAAELEVAAIRATELLDAADDGLIVRGAYVASIALAFLGRTQEALVVAEQGEEARRRSPDSRYRGEATLTGASLAYLFRGQLAQAATAADLGYQVSLDAGDDDGIAMYAMLGGSVLVEQGRLAAAATAFRDGAAVSQVCREPSFRRGCLGGVGLSEGMAGNASAAWAAMDELDELPPHWISLFDAILVDRGRAWAEAAAGRVSAACGFLERAAETAARSKQVVAEARLLHDMLRLGQRHSIPARIAALATKADGEVLAALARHASAVAAGSATQLQAAAETFTDLGALLLAAEAATAAAAAYRSEGLPRPAAAMTREAARLADLCGPARTPAVSAAGSWPLLTQRERETATLAARGRSSRQIAEQLFISVRTVENHLQRAYTKLGVTGREGLADALGLHGGAVADGTHRGDDPRA